MSRGPALAAGPPACERCGRPTALAVINAAGDPSYLCAPCLASLGALCPACAGVGRTRQLTDDRGAPCAACAGTGHLEVFT
jgi:hypothetical protein